MAINSYIDSLIDFQNNTQSRVTSDKEVAFIDENVVLDNAYEINLNTRDVKIPKFLGIQYDTNSSRIIFKCSRYYEGIDLTKTSCVIEFKTSAKENNKDLAYIPIYYVDPSDSNTMYFAWYLNGIATNAAGSLTFVIRFYAIDETTITATEVGSEDEFNEKEIYFIINDDGKYEKADVTYENFDTLKEDTLYINPTAVYIFNLSTTPKSGTILQGMTLANDELDSYTAEDVSSLIVALNNASTIIGNLSATGDELERVKENLANDWIVLPVEE